MRSVLLRFMTGFFTAGLLVCSFTAHNQNSKVALTVKEVFDLVESKSNYLVFFQNDQVNLTRQVEISDPDIPIETLLSQALAGMNLTYRKVDDHIVIVPEPQVIVKPLPPQYTVTGTVSDEQGLTIPGVNVVVKGTFLGTTTDINGSYSITSATPIDTLIFSFIGYKKLEVAVAGREVVNVVMQQEITTLTEFVAIGYGVKKQSDLMGSVSVIKADEISGLSVSNLAQALQGKSTGVIIKQNTGAPGEGVSVRIRGVGTINDNSPLYIIDGIPTKTGFNTLSNNDIESISILKDASAASIYGSRAANGVIIVTTKKGSKGGTHINFSSNTGIQIATNLTPMCDKDQYIELYNEAAVADGRSIINPEMADTMANTNWWNEIFRPALMANYNLSASGGSEKTNYILSGNYLRQEGIILNSGYERYAVRTSLNTALTDKISVGTNINLSGSTRDVVGSSGDGYGGNGGSVVRYAFFRSPVYPVYYPDGSYIDYYQPYAEFYGDGYNPVGFANKYDWKVNEHHMLGNAFVQYDILDGLVFKTDYVLDFMGSHEKRFNENWGFNDRINNPNSLQEITYTTTIHTWKNTLDYTKTFGEQHHLHALLGTEAITSSTIGQIGSAMNFLDQVPSVRYLDNGTTTQRVTSWNTGWALFSLFGRASYDFSGKYYAEVVLRRDGSSRFGPNYRYGIFPSGSLAWRIDKEKFLEEVENISFMKLRTSFGMLGNQEIGNYSFASLITGGSYYPFTTLPDVGYYLFQHGNENLRWENQVQFNAGLDLGLFNDRLYVYADYFRKVTNDMLVQAPLPPSSGSATPPYFNAGSVLNHGFEAEVNFKTKKKNFYYDLGLVFSHISNRVLELYGDNPILAGRIDNGVYATLTEEGYPIGSFFLYEMEGIFQDQTDIFTHAYQGNNIEPGDVKYKDLSGPDGVPDGVIDAYDRRHVGSPIPDFTVGFTGNATYRNWSVSLFLEGVYGNEIYWQAAHDIEGFYRAFNITERVYDERWTGPGTSDTQPRVSWSGATNNKKPSTRFLFDGSYMRIKNISLGYTFDFSTTRQKGLNSLHVFLSAQNLLTLSNYPGLDPEMQTSNNAASEGDLAAGIDWGTYPSAMIINLGINISL
ncbi:MAG: TonB-dependent receptor [Bacteroidales bacterium]|nr:TonB-dependent receptor [Bacteroidales bacterium]